MSTLTLLGMWSAKFAVSNTIRSLGEWMPMSRFTQMLSPWPRNIQRSNGFHIVRCYQFSNSTNCSSNCNKIHKFGDYKRLPVLRCSTK
jgi:hypothetical protein